MKVFVFIFVSTVFYFGLSSGVSAEGKTKYLEKLQGLVNDPLKAREERRRIRESSGEDSKELDELDLIIKNEINTISSSLPMKVDKHTTMYAAGMSGNNIAFKYTLSNNMPGLNHKAEVVSGLSEMLKNSMCTSPAGAYLILGYIWSYYYFYENGKYYSGVIIDAKTCGFE